MYSGPTRSTGWAGEFRIPQSVGLVTRTVRATYRLQFRRSFPFAAGAAIAGYLRQLGISHVYVSPILSAREGSAHGYDVVRYDRISEELGGEDGFRAMAAVLQEHDIGIVLDIVPNHVAVGGGDNPMWLDLLKNGRNSAYATWFDIDFDHPDPLLSGKIHAPFLSETVRVALAERHLTLHALSTGGYAVLAGDHYFPVRAEDEPAIDRLGVEAFQAPDALGELLSRQHYVLDVWRNAGDRINWRRFFDITQLAAMRMETPAAFAAKHAVPLSLYRDGVIDGLRIDHVDGLADPAGYCRQLRHALAELDQMRRERGKNDRIAPAREKPDRCWLLVEKILADGEVLATDWDVDGTTGYDFMNDVCALQHDAQAEGALAAYWAMLSGRSPAFDDEESAARREILDRAFAAQRERLVDVALACKSDGAMADWIPRAAMRRAVTDVLSAMRVYRGYEGDETVPVTDEGYLDAPVNEAFARAAFAPTADKAAIAALHGAMVDKQVARRFHHLSAPLAAKAVEDTAFYRYGRLISRNDVGFHAANLAIAPDEFHRRVKERSATFPRSMLATATHDHKRGEDARARLAVISECPAEWMAVTQRWLRLNAALHAGALARADEYLFYQMLVGTWPPGLLPHDADGLRDLATRLGEWWRKALREAKLRSSWSAASEKYESLATRFASASLDPAMSGEFIADVGAFVAGIERPGAANALVQLTLRCLCPGVPDTYQGTELWDFSMVDPDNRRAVDYALRRDHLATAEPWAALARTWQDGRVKQSLLARLLALRGEWPTVFAQGRYEPVMITGRRAEHAIAFRIVHADAMVLVVAGRCLAQGLSHPCAESRALTPPREWWGDTALDFCVERNALTSVIGGHPH